MFTVLWFLFVAFVLSTAAVWLLDHNGLVEVLWLGYEIKTDVLTVILLGIILAVAIFVISYILAKILALKFPNFIKLFFQRNYLKTLEKTLEKHQTGFALISKTLLALEVGNQKESKESLKNLHKFIKNEAIENFLAGKIALQEHNFAEAIKLFSKFDEDNNAKILLLKSNMGLALQNNDEDSAIAYAKQILENKNHNLETAKILLSLYKKRGFWQEARKLIASFGTEYFAEELKERDLVVINTGLAIESYQNKNFFNAIKFANLALRQEKNFLPAIEVKMKSWLKLGFVFKVRWQIKSLWRENPHLVLAEIFDLSYRKSSPKSRILAMKKLAKNNSESALGKLAIGLVAFRVGDFKTAKDFLNASLNQEKTYRGYKILAFVNKFLGEEIEMNKNLKKAELMQKDDHYFCTSCGHLSARWNAKCSSCDSYDSLEWNY